MKRHTCAYETPARFESLLFTLFLLLASLHGQVTYPRSYKGTDVIQAGRPPFNASSRAGATAQLPSPYNGDIVQLVDINTYNNQSWTVPGGGAAGKMTNQNTSLIALSTMSGTTCLFGFNTQTDTVFPTKPKTCVAGGSGFSWSQQQRWYVFPSEGQKVGPYTANGTTIYYADAAKLASGCGSSSCYDSTKVTWGVLVDLAQACPALPSGAPTWHGEFKPGAADKDFFMALSYTGGQNTGRYIVDYQVASPHTCITIDTIGNGASPLWYSSADPRAANVMLNYSTGVPLEASFLLHNAQSNGTWGTVATRQCVGADCGGTKDGPIVLYTWKGNTPVFTAYSMNSEPHPDGHFGLAVNLFMNDSNPDAYVRDLTAPSTANFVTNSLGGEDFHLNGDETADSSPFLGVRGGVATKTWNQPYMNETLAIASDGSNTIYRFSPTWSGGPCTNFYGEYAISSYSQDRRRLFFTSDMEGCTHTFVYVIRLQ